MKKLLLLAAVLFSCSSFLKSQTGQTDLNGSNEDCLFTHYSSEDGLSQNTIMGILQDRKGNLWFSTWDGINCFDGYTFKVYKATPHNEMVWANNRVDQMEEDAYGFIWVRTYDNQAYRFDPCTETFEQIPVERGESAAVESIKALKNGTVWLLTLEGGAIRLTADENTSKLSAQAYTPRSGAIAAEHVSDIYEDQAGNEWILTDNGLYRQARNETTPVAYFQEKRTGNHTGKGQPFFCASHRGDELLFGSLGRVWRFTELTGEFIVLELGSVSPVSAICCLNEQEVLIATLGDGFFLWHVDTGEMEHYEATRLPDAPLTAAYVDRQGEVWFSQETPGMVTHFNPQTRVIKTETVSMERPSMDRGFPAFHIHEDNLGHLWVHPYGGGFSLFNRATNSLQPFYNALNDPGARFSNRIHAAFSDRQGNLWLGTHSKGLEKVTFRPAWFRKWTLVPRSHETLSNEVRSIHEDRQGNLWVGLKDAKLRVYDKQRNARGYLTENGRIAFTGTPMDGCVYDIMEDKQGILWISTKGKGLVKAEPLPGGTYRLTRYRYDKNDIYSLSDDDVYCTYEDMHGRIWIATFGGGLNYLNPRSEGKAQFINHRNNLKQYPVGVCSRVRCVTGDDQGRIWVGTSVGVLMLESDFRSPEQAVFHHYLRSPQDKNCLSNNDVHRILFTSNKELYLATFGGGLNKLLTLDKEGKASFKAYDMSDGLSSDILLTLCEDRKGNLWMSTENGLSKFIPSEEKIEKYGDHSLPFPVRFSEAAALRTAEGQMLFGMSDGIFYFSPDKVKKSSYLPSIVLSRLLVAGNEVVPDKAEGPLRESLDDTRKLTLSHRENIFSIRYAALDYSSPSDIHYAYILEGFEKTWNYVGTQRTATYTNLPQGHYVFKVRSTNADGVWVENTRQLDIEVLPSFWETPVAYFVYIILILAVIVTAVYILFTIYRLKHRVVMERQLTDMKLRFFTDISHELRTPLTLISGPVENVLRHSGLPDDAREQLQVVERNTGRMLRLVNQILDFRKIQNHKMKMLVQRINVASYSRRIMQNFESLAEEHHIDFIFETEEEGLVLWVDADKYEKILFNLLSNAFKYTPDGRMIKVFVHENEHTISVGVQDQGIGIAENKKKSIFVRFENLMESNLFKQSSTGIGLSLVKELAEMHKATISVESRLNAGSCFKVEFLKGKEHYDSSAEFLLDDATAQAVAAPTGTSRTGETDADDTTATATEATPSDDMAETSPDKDTMLLIEDNAELRLFLRSIFVNDFRIVEASDGLQGRNKALKYLPDIIISDVMMPEKDGIEVTVELRRDMTTSHIPIILLTAKDSIESRLKGLELGADDYITKPFSATYLKARVKNLLAQRRKLQEAYRTSLMQSAVPVPVPENAQPADEATHAPELSPNDRKFMDKLLGLMEKNMDNGDLIVDDLVSEMAVSRSVFFKKLKTITGLAPIEFIKEMRISRAVQLIETDEYSMTQIAYMVGINDPRYFSKCFKQKMGMTPTEYKDKKLHRK